MAFKDKLVFNHESCPDGLFLGGAHGGRKIAQVWVRQPGEAPILSDAAFMRDLSHFSLLVLVRNSDDVDPAELMELLVEANLPDNILTMDDVTYYHINPHRQGLTTSTKLGGEIYHPCTAEELVEEGINPIRGYSHTAVEDRLPRSVRFVLLRPDFFIHSAALNTTQLSRNLREVRDYFQ